MKPEELKVGDEIEVTKSTGESGPVRTITALETGRVLYLRSDSAIRHSCTYDCVLHVSRPVEAVELGLRIGDEFEADWANKIERRVITAFERTCIVYSIFVVGCGETAGCDLLFDDFRVRCKPKQVAAEPPVGTKTSARDIGELLHQQAEKFVKEGIMPSKTYTFNLPADDVPDWARILRENGGASHVCVDHGGKHYILVPRYVQRCSAHAATAYVQHRDYVVLYDTPDNQKIVTDAVRRWRSRVEVTVRSYR